MRNIRGRVWCVDCCAVFLKEHIFHINLQFLGKNCYYLIFMVFTIIRSNYTTWLAIRTILFRHATMLHMTWRFSRSILGNFVYNHIQKVKNESNENQDQLFVAQAMPNAPRTEPKSANSEKLIITSLWSHHNLHCELFSH